MINISFWNILFTVVNLLILFIAFRIFFFKPIRKIIEARKNEVDEMYAKANAENEAAEARHAEYDEKLVSVESEKKQILATARKTADDEYQTIVNDARTEAKQIREDAVAAAVHEKEEIIGSAKKEIAQMVVDATTKVVGSKAGAEVDSELYDKFIVKAGEES